MPSTTRRDFAKTSAGAGIALIGTAGVLSTASSYAYAAETAEDAKSRGQDLDATEQVSQSHQSKTGYGPLIDDPKGLLALPAGFSYKVVTHAGVTKMESGEFTPNKHDGTAAFKGTRGSTLLVVNHEIRDNRANTAFPVPLTPGLVYDPSAPGGCTVVEISKDGECVAEWVGIAGTQQNCAGGRSPWGTWLTCEENSAKVGEAGMTKAHGYVFEVDPYDRRANKNPKPIKALGRYDHEAVVVDTKRGHLYLTEDAAGPNGLFYRWTPPKGFKHGRGKLRTLSDTAGVLEAFKCFDSKGQFVDDLSRATKAGTSYSVKWVAVADRDAKTVPTRQQFTGTQVTRARKLEGMWWADGGTYVVSSFAREESPVQHDGQVWFYDPARGTLTLKLILGVNPDPDANDGVLDGPDNITVSPYGGVILAEDGEGIQHLFGATESGKTYPIARNQLNDGTAEDPSYSEFAGVVFSPDGKTLYASIQNPGILLAITGPWRYQR
ncbi:alkaline phosphatase PhoX [Streptomyces sp. NPDC060065]|uniref:alkaline phosphatase PhoX n=1 Tax=Streptomyces sp. NPDC060065 TaxID=3347050 RepID=UPI0036906A30